MQNNPRHYQVEPLPKRSVARSSRTSRNSGTKSLVSFLLNTNIAPLVLVGRGVENFGVRTVAGFLLGATMVYGYAFFKPLPYARQSLGVISPSPVTTTVIEPPVSNIRLRGVVKDSEGQPIKEPFMVGVMVKRFGPLKNIDGSFAIEVPKSASYDLALWNMNGKFQLYDGYSPEREGEGYVLPPMPFLQTAPAGNPGPRSGGHTLAAGTLGP
jgi:hypothetical protein